MKKKILILPALLITGALMITGCSSLKTMKKNADKISYTVVPGGA